MKMKTTATLLIALFLASMLSVVVLGLNPAVDHIEWLPPLTKHDEFGFKDGSTLPIKFRLLDSSGSFVMDNPTVTVNDLLFSDDFEDPIFTNPEWTTIAGDWAIENDEGNVYSQNDVTGNSAQRWALAGDYGWDDYIFEVKAKGMEGHYPGYDENTWVGLAFRAKDDTHFYEYYFRTTSQDIIVVKHDGGSRTVVSGPVSFTCANGNWYKLKVIAEGNSFRFFVDDVEISGLAFTDTTSPFMTGKVGLYVWDGTHAHFDEVFVLGDEKESFSIGYGLETPLKYELFGDDFEDGDSYGWTPGPGTWSIESGSYVYSKLDEGIVLHTYSLIDGLTVSDFSAEVKITQLTTTQRDSGIQFWHQDSNNYYYANFDRDALGLWLFQGGGYVLVKSKSHSYIVTEPHTIKVLVQGTTFKMYVDGNLEWTDTLTEWFSGGIGVHAHRDSHTQFDDVLVLGYQYQCDLHTKELVMPAGEYMITVSGDGYEYQYPFMLFEGGKAKGKSK